MYRGIVRPLRKVQVSKPVAGFVVDVGAEILFQSPIDDLSLSVGLRMIRCRHSKLGAAETEELLPELAEEQSVPV